MISKKMIGIDVDSANDSAQTKPNHAPIVAGRATPSRFPTVHPFAPIRKLVGNENSATRPEKIFFRSEEFIIRDERRATDSFCREIDKTGGSGWWRIRCIHSRTSLKRQDFVRGKFDHGFRR